MSATAATPPAAQSIDLVVTRYKEPVGWLNAYTGRPEWRVFLYNTGPRLPTGRLCRSASVSCTQVGNAGYEWHGYLRYLIDHYDALPSRTIFLQANPETAPPSVGASRPGAAANAPSSTPRQRQIERRAASSLGQPRPASANWQTCPSLAVFPTGRVLPRQVSPDITCLLNQTERYLPVQPLSWVQQAKRKMPLFSECQASYLGGCRVWVEPVTAGLRPMLHGDRWLHRACRMAKRMRGNLFQFLYSQVSPWLGLGLGLGSGLGVRLGFQVLYSQVPTPTTKPTTLILTARGRRRPRLGPGEPTHRAHQRPSRAATLV